MRKWSKTNGFAPPPYVRLEPVNPGFETERAADPHFERWCGVNLAQHKQPGYAIVDISLKPLDGVPGDVTAAQMEGLADLAERYGFSEIRATHWQNLVLPHVRLSDVHAVWLALAALGLATPNIGLASDVIACPGLDYCNLANARSIPVAQAISRRFADLKRLNDIGDLRINISGCINACGHHHVGNIGLLGVDKKGEEYYQVTLGGSDDENATLGELVGPAFPYDAIVDAVETIVNTYMDRREPGEQFLATYRRVGLGPFKESLYGAHPKDNALRPDPWVSVADEAELPESDPAIVSFERWGRDRALLARRNGPLGLRLRSDQPPEGVADDLAAFDLIALEFPKFTDGRAYSYARLLRERYGFEGELRAVGNVLRDQLFFMRRCGFDAFEVADDVDLGAWLEALGEIDVVYQPAADDRRPFTALRTS